MKLSEFDYELSDDRIALHPADRRDASRLFVLDRASGRTTHTTFAELPAYLREGDALVLNETRVRLARLVGRRASGGRVELLLVRPHPSGGWDAMVKPGRRLRAGEPIEVRGGRVRVCEELAGGRRRVELEGADGGAVDPDAIGEPALPPYIRREAHLEDRERYQTVYARELGAIAAPTAGLHFTPELLERIGAMGVRLVRVVLHVGPGTFLPVTSEEVDEHVMEPEFYRYPEEAARALDAVRERGGRVVAVGTTSARVLETVGPRAAPGEGWTSLFLRPPDRFRAVDALVTNFHLPRSTLLMMIAAFAGTARILAAYREAVAHGYRFYSYGDAMLIL